MKTITAKAICLSCNGKYYGDINEENICVTSIFTDSRKIVDGSMFVAVKGEKVDGHSFVEKCKDQGSVVSLVEDYKKEYEPCIVVKSTLEAVKGIARYYRSLFTIPFIGITGSVGKTSTKEMIYSVLSESFNVHKTQGNFNNELGVPLTIFGLEEYHQVAVIEMGISDFGEMTRLAKIVRPNICVITNIGDCHLEKLIDRNGVVKAKTEMFAYMQKNGKIFLCGDDDKLSAIKEYNGIKPTFFGINSNNSYYVKDIKNSGDNCISCTMCYDNKEVPATIPALGNHMASNAMAAVAIGVSLGMDDESIRRGVENFKTVGSRSNVIKTKGYTVIDDCYNANPTSMKSSVDMLLNFKSTRHIAIMGDMKELGKNEELLHKEVGQYIIGKLDLLITVGELAKNISDNFTGEKVHFNNLQNALENIEGYIKQGDSVLVKASHSMQFEKIVEKIC